MVKCHIMSANREPEHVKATFLMGESDLLILLVDDHFFDDFSIKVKDVSRGFVLVLERIGIVLLECLSGIRFMPNSSMICLLDRHWLRSTKNKQENCENNRQYY
jgi:hypothetical protein